MVKRYVGPWFGRDGAPQGPLQSISLTLDHNDLAGGPATVQAFALPELMPRGSVCVAVDAQLEQAFLPITIDEYYVGTSPVYASFRVQDLLAGFGLYDQDVFSAFRNERARFDDPTQLYIVIAGTALNLASAGRVVTTVFFVKG